MSFAICLLFEIVINEIADYVANINWEEFDLLILKL